MSDIFEVIKNRRSVRAYKDEQIDDEDIEKILHAAIWLLLQEEKLHGISL